MTEAFERALAVNRSCEERVVAELPPDGEIFDAHVHIGTDIDGMRGRLDELLDLQRRHRVSGAIMFCLDEPDRHPAFTAANDRSLATAAESGGRIVPFVRLDLEEGPVAEATRCLDLGAKGIKLHPRAQGFLLTDDRLEPIFALAQERAVPILIHGGRGLPPIAAGLARLVEKHPGVQLIIAHAGIADLAGLAGVFTGHPGVFFDTSVWSGLDLLDLFRLVGPEQVLYASDYPYGRYANSLLIAMRMARVSGWDDGQIRGMLGGNVRRLLDNEPPRHPTAPRGAHSIEQPLTIARIRGYIAMASPLLWTRQPDRIGVLGLALNTCREPDGDGHGAAARILPVLEAAAALWREIDEVAEEDRVRVTRTVFQLLQFADIEALSTGLQSD